MSIQEEIDKAWGKINRKQPPSMDFVNGFLAGARAANNEILEKVEKFIPDGLQITQPRPLRKSIELDILVVFLTMLLTAFLAGILFCFDKIGLDGYIVMVSASGLLAQLIFKTPRK